MRWIPERAEALLKLRCICVNNDWDPFIDYTHKKHRHATSHGDTIPLLRNAPAPIMNSIREAA